MHPGKFGKSIQCELRILVAQYDFIPHPVAPRLQGLQSTGRKYTGPVPHLESDPRSSGATTRIVTPRPHTRKPSTFHIFQLRVLSYTPCPNEVIGEPHTPSSPALSPLQPSPPHRSHSAGGPWLCTINMALHHQHISMSAPPSPSEPSLGSFLRIRTKARVLDA